MKKIITLDVSPITKALFLSDIHLQLPVTKDLHVIEDSMVERIEDLASNRDAILVLNGDVFEMWFQTSQTPAEIIAGFPKLKSAIQQFNQGQQHLTVMTVGNHDEAVKSNLSYQKDIAKAWGADICEKLFFNFGGKTAMIEHGHEYDPYNQSEKSGSTHGRELVQKTLPKLQRMMPSLFDGIQDVINRGFLPSYVLSKLVYNILLPAVLPITLVFSLAYWGISNNPRVIPAFLISWLVVWAVVVVTDVVLRYIAHRTLSGGSAYMKNIKKYEHRHHFDYIVLGHTHNGEVSDQGNFVYANSGCNDKVATGKISWLGIYRFDHYLQLGGLEFDASKKQPFKYRQRTVALVK
jgi:UDP-2,3-diacylglucosamine pyrophosphatase LpxH